VHGVVVHDERSGTGETVAPPPGSAAPVPATAAGEPAMPQGDTLPVRAPPPNALQRMCTSVLVAFREGFFVHAGTCCGSTRAMLHEAIL